MLRTAPSNGQLHADLVAGISQTLFKECLIQKLNTPSTRPSSSTLNTNPSTNTSSSMHAVLDERRKRLEADKKRMDAEEKARRMAKAQARREEANTADLDSARAKQAVYALQQRKRQQESRQERERILQVIGNDRIERKERDKLRKDFSRVKSDGYDGAGDLVDAQFLGETGSSRPFASNECAIQIRLLDGSTIRSRFSSEQSLRDSVRPWIDMERPDSIRTPYTFKHVLTPLPNRPILITEEEESLQFLGLQPSATLIMVPVRNCVKIYGEDPGPLSKGLSLGYSVLSSGLGMLSGALGMLLGTGQSAASSTLDETLHRDSRNTLSTAASDLGANVNIRTLRDQRPDQDVRQLYNGNQVTLLNTKQIGM